MSPGLKVVNRPLPKCAMFIAFLSFLLKKLNLSYLNKSQLNVSEIDTMGQENSDVNDSGSSSFADESSEAIDFK
jgi:hypothetical protein